MRSILTLALCGGLLFVGCRRSKSAPQAAPPEPPKQPEASQTTTPPPATPAAVSGAKSAPVTIPQMEAGVEFGDLNNIIEAFEERHKRLPTVEELKKLYYGGTRPIPIPPGYKLIVDPKSKKAKLTPGQ